MKLAAALLVSFLAIVGFPLAILAAGTSEDVGPEIIKLKMGDIYLNFQHWKHQKSNNKECFHCHKPQEWKIKEWDKEIAHQICISCHDRIQKGPVECISCHSTTYNTMNVGHK